MTTQFTGLRKGDLITFEGRYALRPGLWPKFLALIGLRRFAEGRELQHAMEM